MAWPHRADTWPGLFHRIPDVFERLVRTIAAFEPVVLLAGNPTASQETARRFRHIENIQRLPIDTNDVWTRDYGPTIVVEHAVSESPRSVSPEGPTRIIGIDWTYNGWGEKYPPYQDDAAAAAAVIEQQGYDREPSEFVVEGGAIEGNGQGTIVTTRSCLLNANRNPQRTAAAVSAELQQKLGAQRVVWLDGGDFTGDDTDGHIDQLARFVNDKVMVHAACDDRDLNASTLQRLKQQLTESLADVQLLDLPIPHVTYENQRLPASYCNFYILNGAVLLPTFDCDTDDRAVGILRELFPDRELVPFPCRELVQGLGAIHCMTQQLF